MTETELELIIKIIMGLGAVLSGIWGGVKLIVRAARAHLKRIEKIETDLKVAHDRIRELREKAKPQCEVVSCPLSSKRN